jgi:hypothetical protein
MVRLDVVVDEDRYPWVELLPHGSWSFASGSRRYEASIDAQIDSEERIEVG